MKKLILSLFALVIAASTYGATVSYTITNAAAVNVLALNQSGFSRVTSIAIANTNAAGAVTLSLYDSPNATFAITNQAYTNIISYATNYVVFYTNYFGRTNGWTNTMLVDITNAVPATNYILQPKATFAAPALGTLVVNPVSYGFEYGIWVTNSSLSNAVITINYTQ
jgi:hypothetical protein